MKQQEKLVTAAARWRGKAAPEVAAPAAAAAAAAAAGGGGVAAGVAAVAANEDAAAPRASAVGRPRGRPACAGVRVCCKREEKNRPNCTLAVI